MPDPHHDFHAADPGDPHVHHVDVGSAPPVRPASTRRMIIIGIVAILALVLLYVTSALPRRSVAHELVAEADSTGGPPVVQLIAVQRASAGNSVELPGTIEPLHESAIYARVGGYVKVWHADIGSTVRAGDVLAELDAPELAQNVEQARQQLAQVHAALGLARADLARWKTLASDSAVTRQELDQKQAAYDAAAANEGGASANLQRLVDMEGYTKVRAPFAGVVTARNIDIGSLITAAGATSAPIAGGEGAGAGSLFKLAETDTVRTYLPVPENYAMAMSTGLPADVLVQEIPGHAFTGHVVRTSHSLDAGSRTMLTEVDIANPGFKLVPGMYATVRMKFPNSTPAIVVPSSALVIRSNGPQVMVVDSGSTGKIVTVHLRNVQVGRDFGATVEIASGLADGATIVNSPSAELADGAKVQVAATKP